MVIAHLQFIARSMSQPIMDGKFYLIIINLDCQFIFSNFNYYSRASFESISKSIHKLNFNKLSIFKFEISIKGIFHNSSSKLWKYFNILFIKKHWSERY